MTMQGRADAAKRGLSKPSDRLAVSVADAAAALGVSPRFVQTLIARGELPSIVLGRRRLVRRVDLERFLEELGRDEQPAP